MNPLAFFFLFFLRFDPVVIIKHVDARDCALIPNKQILIPKLSLTGSGGAPGFSFPLALCGSEGNHLDGHSGYALHRLQN